MKCRFCERPSVAIGARLCVHHLARRNRAWRRYAERWDDRCAREVARWVWVADAIERSEETMVQALIGDGIIALNAITMQSTGASRPSQRVRFDWHALRLLSRDSAGVDELALRARLRESGMSLRDALQSTAPFALRELARLYRGRLA